MVQKAGSKCRMVGFWGGPSSWITVRNLLAMVSQVKRTGAFSGVFSKMPVLWDSRPTPMASSNFSYFPFQNTAFRTRSRGNTNCWPVVCGPGEGLRAVASLLLEQPTVWWHQSWRRWCWRGTGPEAEEDIWKSRETHKAPSTTSTLYTTSFIRRLTRYPVDFLDKDTESHLDKLRQEPPGKSCPQPTP